MLLENVDEFVNLESTLEPRDFQITTVDMSMRRVRLIDK